MGTTLHMRQVEDRLETQKDELIQLSGDLDAFVWEIEEALRNARHGDPDADAMQKLSVRAAGVLAVVDGLRKMLPPRIADVMVAGLKIVENPTVPLGKFKLVMESTPKFSNDAPLLGMFDSHRYMK